MNFILDLAPALLFFGTYAALDLYAATAVLIVALFALVAIYWLRQHRIHKMHLVTALAAAVFGGLTLYLRDPAFIKLKPTVVYGLLSAALLASHFVGRRVLLARIPQHTLRMPDPVWRRVNFAWVLFFAACAALNLWVARHFSERVWVGFNTFGFTVLTLLFLMAHAPFLSRYVADS
ncbi:MAG: septation protein IspZ [Gammaproteobacteria bacterium]|nr:septation protein IspZ [Gammaproteobacteria bacterium]